MPPPIIGAPTAIAAFVGAATRGPVDEPVAVRSLVEFENAFGGAPATPLAMAVALFFLNGGRDAVVVRVNRREATTTTDDEIAAPELEGASRGLWALDRCDLFTLLCVPPLRDGADGDIGVRTRVAAARYAERRRAIYIADPLTHWTTAADVLDARAGVESAGWGLPRTANAAVYFPYLLVADPADPSRQVRCAPSGGVAGAMARVDASRGVWKAAAGADVHVTGTLDVSVRLSDRDNALLNPHGVNCLRRFLDAGPVIWGARTLAGADPLASEWKYLPVRRLGLHIEESIERGTRWAALEANNESLWRNLRRVVSDFLLSLFRAGAFQASTPRDAFFIKCDQQTTTQADIDAGVVVILVGFAPIKPAEFILLTVRQSAGEGSTSSPSAS